MMKLPLLVPAFLLALCGGSVRMTAAQPHHPVATGTFIQPFLVKDWNDARWQSELRYLKAVGMRYLVLSQTVDSKAQTAYYPTSTPGYRLESGYTDIVGACLRNAQKSGFQVFLGLNFDEDWWRKEASDPAWLDARMDAGNACADELVARYSRRYPRAFRGWYWAWEVDNLNFRTESQQRILAEALDRSVRHLHRLTPKLPVMLCPFMNSRFGTPEAYAAAWCSLFAMTSLRSGDIFCPQDCVGAGGLKLEEIPAWFRMLGEAVRKTPGLRFWSDTETFDQEDWTSAPLNRFVAQLKAAQPYVEQSLTFAYSHYYSPNIANSGFQRTYLKYVQTGGLDSVAPSEPTDLSGTRQADGAIQLSWTPSTDDTGICGYNLLRNGTRIRRLQSDKGAKAAASITIIDKAPPGPNTKYSVQAYDFAGNVSIAAETIVR